MLYVWFYIFRRIDAHVRHRHSTYIDHEIDPPQADSKAQGEWGLRRSYSMQLPGTELPAHAFPLLTDWCLSAGFLMMSSLWVTIVKHFPVHAGEVESLDLADGLFPEGS